LEFINRQEELRRLFSLMEIDGGALAVIYGRRRVGKSRLLIEWCERHGGLYWVADDSSQVIQRKYFAQACSDVFEGFDEVDYPNWSVLLKALSREARSQKWQGPLVIDELPFLVQNCPEMSSQLQHWVDGEKRTGLLKVGLAGSSQQMMNDVVIKNHAPLYGRADELMCLQPMTSTHLKKAFPKARARELLISYTLWGGVPRYWELATRFGIKWQDAIDELALSPLGVLHDEINRLLREELPSATHLRPILDAIGMGSHRLSEIGARLGVPSTSLSRPLATLRMLGLVKKETPFGENEQKSKRTQYQLSDPFLRFWFKCIAPHQGALSTIPSAKRLSFLQKELPNLIGVAFEELCRELLPLIEIETQTFTAPRRYWGAGEREWDLCAESMDGSCLLLGECKSFETVVNLQKSKKELLALVEKGIPKGLALKGKKVIHVLFVPESKLDSKGLPENQYVIDLKDLGVG
jgi:AAA+ ATPase superfamily predicted ATPase